MKKRTKIIIAVLLTVIIVLPVISYIGIVHTNNYIADKIKKDLIAYRLPDDTVLIDSISEAGKLTGNGNGMQYMGAILVETELSEKELREYYSSQFDFIEVIRQEDAKMDFIDHGDYSYAGFPDVEGKSYYSIVCWDSNRSDIYGDFGAVLLDFDIRAH